VKKLLDECLPRRLAKYLPGHDVRTVREMKWLGLSNGRRLAAASDFDIFITVDKNLVNQTQIKGRHLAVVVLRAKSNKMEDIEPLVPQLRNCFAVARPGTVTTLR
jgi:predicted nuclease of predicted toxin-antitoxin system